MNHRLVGCLFATIICHTAPTLFAQDATAPLADRAYGLLKKYCYGCHGVKFEVEGFNVLKRDVLLGGEKKYVIAGQPDQSVLWRRTGIDGEMPPDGSPKPSAAELATIKQWIVAGAPFPASGTRKFISDSDVLTAVRNDLRRTPQADRRYRRYFSLANLHNNSFTQRIGKNGKNVDDSELPLMRAAVSKLVNSLSWKPIAVPVVVDANQVVLRIDLRDVGWDRRGVWTEILRAYPYAVKWHVHPDEALRELAIEVYQLAASDVPVIRADWFIDTAARPPLYYQILDLPKLASDVERLLKVDVEEDFLKDQLRRAGFAESGVSKSNRLVDRHKAAYGAYWKSYDFKRSEGEGNLVQFPLGPAFARNPLPRQAFAHDGGEMIFNLPNGLQGYFLTDAPGNRIDAGPPEVVRDLKETSGSILVVNGLSCMACHERGVVRFKDSVRNGLAVDGAARLKVQRLFPTEAEMERLLDQDEARFMKALTEAIGPFLQVGADKGKDIRQFPEAVGSVARAYQRDLEIEEAAVELGMSDPKELATFIKANSRLRELGLGPLVPGSNGKGAAIKRTTWAAAGGLLSLHQRVASELDLGTPYRER